MYPTVIDSAKVPGYASCRQDRSPTPAVLVLVPTPPGTGATKEATGNVETEGLRFAGHPRGRTQDAPGGLRRRDLAGRAPSAAERVAREGPGRRGPAQP